MSNQSRDYYYSSSRGSHGHERLPPIRDVVGDELDRGTRPNAYAFHDVRGALPTTSSSSRGQHDERGPTLPPIHRTGGGNPNLRHLPATTSSSSYRSSSPRLYSEQAGAHGDYHRSSRVSAEPGYDYPHGATATSSTAPSTHRTQAASSTPSQMQDDAIFEKRHKCEYCGKRFDRPSSLQVHVRTHTGSQPFACEWPGCDRVFSVKSNMLRHWRSHEKSEVVRHSASGHSHHDDDDDDEPVRLSATSSGHRSSSSYYSSSRH